MKRRPYLLRALQHALEAFVLQLARDIEDFCRWEDHADEATDDEPKMGFGQ